LKLLSKVERDRELASTIEIEGEELPECSCGARKVETSNWMMGTVGDDDVGSPGRGRKDREEQG
jgi:hypothetical protein